MQILLQFIDEGMYAPRIKRSQPQNPEAERGVTYEWLANLLQNCECSHGIFRVALFFLSHDHRFLAGDHLDQSRRGWRVAQTSGGG